eukprot:CAMPEP_0176415954 /NCGR_PEP_ID=MMETSP0127-20121128/6085_1 /TAXON_ID=938130 /ORGANISM="Platyophrya macrostoma, Strain WH" /LENGTH=324 /DNA_ID=CAMNT_0017795991 /DNA_START=25 /DNA_END=999 /DNA_ORIENTATION=-
MSLLDWLLYVLLPLSIILCLIRLYVKGRSCHFSPNLEGKVVIVTGANAGIGFYTALRLAELGARLVLACRDSVRTEPAIKEIKDKTGSSTVEFIKLDLGSKKSIREFVDIFKSKYDRLDILVNNAGLVTVDRTLTSDGFETQFGVNHLGHFYLTHLLKDYLIKSAPSRIVTVASDAHQWGVLDFDDLMTEKKKYSSMKCYGNTKLANICHANELNRRLESLGVKAVSLHPGAVKTDIMSSSLKGKWYKWILEIIAYPIFAILFKDAERGAQTTLYCALIEHEKLESGKYYVNCRPTKTNKNATDPALWKRLWDESLRLLEIKDQ